MKEIRVHIELTERAIAVDRRYCISLGDGIHGSSFVLGPKDQFSRPEWEFYQDHLSYPENGILTTEKVCMYTSLDNM